VGRTADRGLADETPATRATHATTHGLKLTHDPTKAWPCHEPALGGIIESESLPVEATAMLGSSGLWLAIAVVLGADDAAKPLAGEWVVRSIEADGATLDAPLPPESCLLTIRGDRIEFFIVNLAAGMEEKGTFSVVEARPDHFKVDVRVVAKSGSDLGRRPDREFVRKELWRLTDGGRLQRCYPSEPSGARPATFSTRKGDGVEIMTFERRAK
jgi:hypothetical protein